MRVRRPGSFVRGARLPPLAHCLSTESSREASLVSPTWLSARLTVAPPARSPHISFPSEHPSLCCKSYNSFKGRRTTSSSRPDIRPPRSKINHKRNETSPSRQLLKKTTLLTIHLQIYSIGKKFTSGRTRTLDRRPRRSPAVTLAKGTVWSKWMMDSMPFVVICPLPWLPRYQVAPGEAPARNLAKLTRCVW